MKMNQNHRRGFTLVELLVVIVIIASLAGLTAPMVIRQRKKADQTEAVNNSRQVGLAMFEFETEYGRFPDSTTVSQITDAGLGTGLTMTGTDANAYFRQLIGAGFTQSETMFYVKTPQTSKPDGNINGAAALAAGEVGFGYILRNNVGLSTAGNPARPYVVTPLAASGTDTFNPDPFDGKAVVLRIDNSATSLQINPTSRQVTLSPGNTLLSTGVNTVWGDTGGTPAISRPIPRS
ncbi:MAG: prepilin-type N-terminal cleavage/methylation domain-containing protein [Armatimonadetes bacterium]|nr:prepilin-type N-terminal cleavage/methylation domain-containing protein [Akkermansiaceae bacterium]